MSATLNMFDLIFIISFAIIVFIAFLRGFTKEIFSLIGWIISVCIVYFLSPILSSIISQYSSDKIVANIISSVIIFIVIFIISSLVTRKISLAIKEKIPAVTDQILGVVYGILKTFLIFGLVYSLSLNLNMKIYSISGNASLSKKLPDWLYKSKFRVAISPFGKALNPLVSKLFDASQERYLGKKIKSEKVKKDIKNNKINQILEEKKMAPYGIYQEKAKKYGQYKEKGYSEEDIKNMERLIDIVE